MNKPVVESLKGIVWIVTTAFALFFFFEGRYLHAEEGRKTHTEIRKDMIVSELRQLSAKQKKESLELWEKLRKEDLERQLQELSK